MVARVDNKNNNPKIILSRTSPVFLQRLFEMEVPEINDGLITIKKIARIPGERAKIAVESYDDRIDPVGACVGVKGSRIHGIVRELRNENIDVINYTSNISLFIQRALSPAKISSIRLNEEEKKAEVFLKPEEVSLAIGKGGLNIKLASIFHVGIAEHIVVFARPAHIVQGGIHGRHHSVPLPVRHPGQPFFQPLGEKIPVHLETGPHHLIEIGQVVGRGVGDAPVDDDAGPAGRLIVAA